MADSFDQIWREVNLYSTAVPPQLVQNWVRDSFRDIIRHRLWSWAVRESDFAFPDVYTTGTVSVTNDDATVTGSGTTFTSAMVGRQIKIDNQIKTITSFTSTTSIEMESVWPEDSKSGASYSILLAYVTAPADFKGFLSVVDPGNNWRINTHLDIRDLDVWDAGRTSTGNPVAVADLRWNQTTGSIRPMYEVWPHVTAQTGALRYLYWIIHPDVSKTQALPYTITGDVVKSGALWRLSRWPGTIDSPNPMYNRQEAQLFRQEFTDRLNDLAREDKEIYPNDLWYTYTNLPYAPLDARYYQSHGG